ncbi:GntR family transcriptional regulator [Micromonospora sp. NPDC047707]|uniref:GntR family transcriptional regulator n=1 Tax=Micromonospora sp. NPDC047707 TaxID=3154498 RepID=UPI003452F65A
MTTSAQDTTYRWLKDRIASLPRHEGVFLTEAEVAAESGVSRTPVREALLRLEAEGLLQIMPKKGAFVPPVSDADVEATMQARLLVEQWAAAQVAASPHLVVPHLQALLEEQAELLEVSDPRAFIEADRRFHRAIVQTAGNRVLADFYETLRDRQIRMGLRAVTADPGRGQKVIDEHTAIMDALRSLDAGGAVAAVKTHLDNTLAALRYPAHGVALPPWQVRANPS